MQITKKVRSNGEIVGITNFKLFDCYSINWSKILGGEDLESYNKLKKNDSEFTPIVFHDPLMKGLSLWQNEVCANVEMIFEFLEDSVSAQINQKFAKYGDQNTNLSEKIELHDIQIPRSKDKGIGLFFQCSWNEQNGIGVRYINRQKIIIGDARLVLSKIDGGEL